jgi:hypothetical protein
MKKSMIKKAVSLFILTLFLSVLADTAIAQIKEPEVIGKSDPKTPLSEGYHNALGFDLVLNNFGFGIGGTYGRAVAPYTEITFRTGITGIRDASEQNFQSFLTGQQIVPNKYKRAFGFPFLLGVKQRLFARQIEDNMRFFVSAAGGPALAFTYPYVSDTTVPQYGEPNGFRDFQVGPNGFLYPVERINDFFSGWGEGETKWGYSGAIKVGVDLGSKFKSRTTIEFGYFFYYFSDGLQIMEPYKPTEYNADGEPIFESRVEFFDAQKYFGSPQIKFTFGGMW